MGRGRTVLGGAHALLGRGWYHRIVEEGYPDRLPVDANGRVTQNAWAFMPLLSGLATLLGRTGWSFYARAAIVSILASAGAAVVMDRWLSPLRGGAPPCGRWPWSGPRRARRFSRSPTPSPWGWHWWR